MHYFYQACCAGVDVILQVPVPAWAGRLFRLSGVHDTCKIARHFVTSQRYLPRAPSGRSDASSHLELHTSASKLLHSCQWSTAFKVSLSKYMARASKPAIQTHQGLLHVSGLRASAVAGPKSVRSRLIMSAGPSDRLLTVVEGSRFPVKLFTWSAPEHDPTPYRRARVLHLLLYLPWLCCELQSNLSPSLSNLPQDTSIRPALVVQDLLCRDAQSDHVWMHNRVILFWQKLTSTHEHTDKPGWHVTLIVGATRPL